MTLTYYFVGNNLIATSPRPHPWDDLNASAANLVFVCPVCGDAWGRVVRDHNQWMPLARPCGKHEVSWNEFGGSFLPPWMDRLTWMPEDLLNYELNLLLRNPKYDN